jgi:hypothetical protein
MLLETAVLPMGCLTPAGLLGLKLDNLVELFTLFSLEPHNGVEFLVHRWE